MATVLFACVTLLATTYFYDYVRSIWNNRSSSRSFQGTSFQVPIMFVLDCSVLEEQKGIWDGYKVLEIIIWAKTFE